VSESREELVLRLRDVAVDIRQKIIEMTCVAGNAHLGGALSAADILVVLYHHVLRIDPRNPQWSERDRFILSKGHGGLAIFPVLADVGFFPREELATFNQMSSRLGMHPNKDEVPGIEVSTGSLGHGLSVSVGLALAGRLDHAPWRVYCLLSDGELNEGSSWEAAMSAAHYKLGNLVAIVDRNRFSLDGPTEEIMGLEPLRDKWAAFGWQTVEVDGHDIAALLDIFDRLPSPDDPQPTVVIAHTVKGKGVSFMENRYEWHYGSLTEEQARQALAELEAVRPAGRVKP